MEAENYVIPDITKNIEEFDSIIIPFVKKYNKQVQKVVSRLKKMIYLSDLLTNTGTLGEYGIRKTMDIERLGEFQLDRSKKVYAKITIEFNTNGTCNVYGYHVRNINEETLLNCERDLTLSELFDKKAKLRDFLRFKNPT